MYKQHRPQKHYEWIKDSQKVYAVVLANLSSDESPGEIKLHCGMRNVINLEGPESKSCNLFDLGFFLYVCI